MDQDDIFKKKFLILQQLSSAIAFSENINAVANLLLDLAISYVHAEKGSLMLLTERSELIILAAKGLDIQLVRSYRSKIGEGIAGIVADNRSPVLVTDIEQDQRFKSLRRDHYTTKSFISCPIISKSRLLGVLNINDKQDGTPFSEDEFELINTLANHAAVALENAFLLSQLKAKAEELEDINKKLVETDILKTEFLTRISHELRTPLNSAKGAIYLLQQSKHSTGQDQKEYQDIIADEIEKLISLVENLLGFLRMEDETRIIKKTVLNIGDCIREILLSRQLTTTLSRKGVRMTATVRNDLPSIVGDKIKIVQLFINLFEGISYYLERGDTIHIEGSENGHVAIDISISRALPETILPILQDTRYLFQIDRPDEQLKLYLAKHIAETHRWKLSAQNKDATCHLSLTIPKSAKEAIATYVDRSMDSFVEFISELLDLEICSIMLSDDLTSELTVKSAVGLDDAIVRRTRIKLGDKIAGWVALEGKPLFIEDIENDPRFGKKSISQYTTKSLMSLPLKIGDRVVGVLNLNNKKTSEPFTDRDYHSAEVISEKIAQFIELLYSGHYGEEELRRCISSLDGLLSGENTPQTKKRLLAALAEKILKSSRELKTDTKIDRSA